MLPKMKLFLLIAVIEFANALSDDSRGIDITNDASKVHNNVTDDETNDLTNEEDNYPDQSHEDVDEHGNPYCPDCDQYHEGNCWALETYDFEGRIPDTPVPEGEPLKALLSVPKGFFITKSKIKGAGRGVIAYSTFHEGTVFGPYGGEYITEFSDSLYCWQVTRKGEVFYYIDGKDIKHSNWMRYINSPLSSQKANLQVFQQQGLIYYAVVKTIHPEDEALIWYGESYGEYLNYKRKVPLRSCSVCGAIFESMNYLQKHEAHHQNTLDQCVLSDTTSNITLLEQIDILS